MKKNENQENGEIQLTFSQEEGKKIKMACFACAAALLAACGTAVYSSYSMTSLRSENELYRNQLDMAGEKMEKISEKVDGIEKISKEVQELVKGSQQNAAGGTGGASTVPDKAEKKAAKAAVHDPGELLNRLVELDAIIDRQMKIMIGLRSELMSDSYTARAIYQSAAHISPSIWPVKGNISSDYGWRVSPAGIGSSHHEGVDIETNYNVPVAATADGVVTRAGWMDGYGYLVEVRHPNGMVTRYGHNSAVVVYEGQSVKQGDTLALAGSTGNSTGPHCHYEVRINGEAVDPVAFLP